MLSINMFPFLYDQKDKKWLFVTLDLHLVFYMAVISIVDLENGTKRLVSLSISRTNESARDEKGISVSQISYAMPTLYQDTTRLYTKLLLLSVIKTLYHEGEPGLTLTLGSVVISTHALIIMSDTIYSENKIIYCLTI